MKWIVAASLLIIAPALSAAETEISKAAKKIGLTTCGDRISGLSVFLLKDSTHGSHSSWNQKAANKHLFYSMTIKVYSDNQSQISTIAAPTSAGGCDMVYVETMVMPGSCASAREKTFKSWKFAAETNGTVVLGASEVTANIYLTPVLNNTACMVAKKEIMF